MSNLSMGLEVEIEEEREREREKFHANILYTVLMHYTYELHIYAFLIHQLIYQCTSTQIPREHIFSGTFIRNLRFALILLPIHGNHH